MKDAIKKIPVLGRVAQRVYRAFVPPRPFKGSQDYWSHRYGAGGTSGQGSFGKLAEFKAEVLNDFVRSRGVESVIEYGCGDGNQLALAAYPSYLGFDVGPAAIEQCRKVFSDDSTKTFKLVADYGGEMADLTLSLDVIYHLIENNVKTTCTGCSILPPDTLSSTHPTVMLSSRTRLPMSDTGNSPTG